MKINEWMKSFCCMGIVVSIIAVSGCTIPASKQPEASEIPSGGQSISEEESTAEKNEALTELVLETEYSEEGYADFCLKKLETTKEVRAAMGGSLSYKNSNDREIYVDMVLDYTNTSSENQSSEDCVVLTAEDAQGKQYTNTMYAVESGDKISTYEDIQPLSKARLHCAVSVPEDIEELTLYLTVGKVTYSYSYTLGKEVADIQKIKAGEELKAEDFASVKYIGTEYTDDLLPPNMGNFYTHYQVDNQDNTYLVVKFDITNKGSNTRDVDQFAGIKAIYEEKYTYTGFVVKEKSDGTGFDNYASLDPLETGHIYFLIEVPKSVTKKTAAVQIFFDGKEYQASVNAQK